jgi:hypothetical protein
VLSQSRSSMDVNNVQTMLVGVANSGFGNPFLQQGTQITSSLIDFTSAQNKLYRQIVASFTALPNDPGITVQLDAWFDQDPTNLSVTPDFTTGVIAAGVNGGVLGQTQLKLRCNRIARKLIYRITTTGPTASKGAVKLISVVIRAATGWTRTMFLDLADNVMVNSKAPGLTAWSAQTIPGQPAMDAMVARDFLRQLWRLEGGECIAVFPGYDAPANWLLQDIHFDSPKPFGVSFRADQRSTLSYLCQVKLREDV